MIDVEAQLGSNQLETLQRTAIEGTNCRGIQDFQRFCRRCDAIVVRNENENADLGMELIR